ncbi:hypothetical protein MFLAVUS_000521 [Mucor flavus]|uniref:RecA family profile 1 domain-containing protein n=1 Tax=Mucor flavus TaxID=439312 RepID=A0ABP9YJZ6_9FUNG
MNKSVALKYNVLKKIKELGLDSAEDLLLKRPKDLQKLLRINEQASRDILFTAAQQIYDFKAREIKTDRLLRPQTVTTGDATMDTLLNPGISLGNITEVVGESSSGKTQFALQLCLTVQLPISEGGQEGSAVYIHNEGPFPSDRLDQLANHNQPDNAQEIKNNIHTMRVNDIDDQFRVLAYALPAFVESQVNQKKPVRLVVIDSIGAVYRSDSTMKRFEKMKEICEVGTRLKKLAYKYNLAVVAVNQVADVIAKNNSQSIENIGNWMDVQLINQKDNQMLGLYIQSLLKKPILGLAWSNSVNTRIRFARSPMLEGIKTRRIMFIEFSPTAERLGCEVRIEQGGVKSYSY